MQLNSSAFSQGAEIPKKYTCKGAGVSPALEITGVPALAQSLALIMHDPDAPGGDFTHWTIWNIAPKTTTIAENAIPVEAKQGQNDFGKTGYGYPCPPSGTHRYIFELYALDTTLQLQDGASRSELEISLAKHIIEKAQLNGLVSANATS
ncbi:MAG TPA: YbhB/YbcL family Raf kinase inhibitor-like protein [Candidatus Saccharimonadales bacterium]|nr:YbhB/YbcL family Raf kinase inhibitor-like protein [Candidatus Saccharimonadales bacterium]